MSDYLSTTQAAVRLQCSDETVRRWIKRGYLAATTLPSGRIRVDTASVDAMLAPDAS